MQIWLIVLSQKYMFTNFVVEVEEMVGEKVVVSEGGREEKVEDWQLRTVNAASAVRMYLNQPEDRDTLRILRIQQLTTGEGSEDVAFKEEQIKQILNEIGEIVMIRTGLLVLNYVWDPIDMPGDSALLIQTPPAAPGVTSRVEVETRTEGETA